jgi:hypothetical protein
MFRPRIIAQFIICHDGYVGTLSDGCPGRRAPRTATTILEQATSTEVEAAKEVFNQRNRGRML